MDVNTVLGLVGALADKGIPVSDIKAKLRLTSTQEKVLGIVIKQNKPLMEIRDLAGAARESRSAVTKALENITKELRALLGRA
ncbi:MAG TPA: hypothetical protein VI953_02800 [Candidatus Paceibacterota bacterium]